MINKIGIWDLYPAEMNAKPFPIKRGTGIQWLKKNGVYQAIIFPKNFKASVYRYPGALPEFCGNTRPDNQLNTRIYYNVRSNMVDVIAGPFLAFYFTTNLNHSLSGAILCCKRNAQCSRKTKLYCPT